MMIPQPAIALGETERSDNEWREWRAAAIDTKYAEYFSIPCGAVVPDIAAHLAALDTYDRRPQIALGYDQRPQIALGYASHAWWVTTIVTQAIGSPAKTDNTVHVLVFPRAGEARMRYSTGRRLISHQLGHSISCDVITHAIVSRTVWWDADVFEESYTSRIHTTLTQLVDHDIYYPCTHDRATTLSARLAVAFARGPDADDMPRRCLVRTADGNKHGTALSVYSGDMATIHTTDTGMVGTWNDHYVVKLDGREDAERVDPGAVTLLPRTVRFRIRP